MTLYRDNLSEAIAKAIEAKYGIEKAPSKKEISLILRELTNVVIIELLKGNVISFRGFGRFVLCIATGSVPTKGKYETLRVKFQSSNRLKRILNPLKRRNDGKLFV